MFFRHPIMPTKANTRHATHWKITKNHVKKSTIFLSKFNLFSIIFGTDFQVRNLNVLEKVLGAILASTSDHVGAQNDIRTAAKNQHEKRCLHEPNISPNMTPRGLPKRPHESASWWRRGPGFPLDRSYAEQAVLNLILTPCCTIFEPILVNRWSNLVIILKPIKLTLEQSATWWTSACQWLCPWICPFWCPWPLHLQG